MSGGSFNYLCDASTVDEIRVYDLDQMTCYLEERYPHHPATVSSRLILNALRSPVDRMLRAVWHDVEWHVSCDYTAEQAAEALDAYAARHAAILGGTS